MARNNGVRMTIATKNGSLIVKNGSIADGCGCCVEWYCCVEYCQPTTLPITSITMSISAQDWLSHTELAPSLIDSRRFITQAFFGRYLNGTHQLPLTSSSSSLRQFSKTIDTLPVCQFSSFLVTATVRHKGLENVLAQPAMELQVGVGIRRNYIFSETQFYELNEFACGSGIPVFTSALINTNRFFDYEPCDPIDASAFMPFAHTFAFTPLWEGQVVSQQETGSREVSVSSLVFNE